MITKPRDWGKLFKKEKIQKWKQYLKSGKVGTKLCLSVSPFPLPPSSVCVGLSGHTASPLPTISFLRVNLTCFLLNDSLFPGVVVACYGDLSFLMTASGL